MCRLINSLYIYGGFSVISYTSFYFYFYGYGNYVNSDPCFGFLFPEWIYSYNASFGVLFTYLRKPQLIIETFKPRVGAFRPTWICLPPPLPQLNYRIKNQQQTIIYYHCITYSDNK